jgi:hypothetical protein
MSVPKTNDPDWKYVAVGNLAVRRVLRKKKK